MHQKRSEVASEGVLEPQNRSENSKINNFQSKILQNSTKNPGFETSETGRLRIYADSTGGLQTFRKFQFQTWWDWDLGAVKSFILVFIKRLIHDLSFAVASL